MTSKITTPVNWIFVPGDSDVEPLHGQADLTTPALLLISAAAAVLSISLQSFCFNVNNNLFHTPIVEHWAADPAFAHDPLIRSLKYYVSGVWALLAWLPFGGHTYTLFLGLHFIARWATLASMSAIAASLGVTQRLPQILLLVWLGLAGSLRGSTSLGNGHMFIDFFSHTELTTPLTLLSLLLLSRRRFFPGFALLGVIFDVNAFTAVWTACAAAMMAAQMILAEPRAAKPLLRRLLLGSATAAVIASPVVSWVYATLSSQPAYRPFDYVEYLRAYYPNHFLIDVAAPADILIFVATIITACVSFKLLGREGRPWLYAFGGFVLVFLVGVAVPYLSHNPTLLNLHLLRVDGIVRVLAVLMLAIVASRFLLDAATGRRWAAVLALILLSLPGPAALVFAAVLLCASTLNPSIQTNLLLLALTAMAMIGGLLQHKMQALPEAAIAVAYIALRYWRRRPPAPTRRVAVALVGLILIPYAVFRGFIRPLNSYSPRSVTDAAKEAAQWARANTDPASVFLVPVYMEPDFELWAKRTVWVDWKQGAAVMWAPSYYWIWRPRMQQVAALQDLPSKVSYACQNNIQYVVTEKTEGMLPVPATLAKRNSQFTIWKLPESCGSRN